MRRMGVVQWPLLANGLAGRWRCRKPVRVAGVPDRRGACATDGAGIHCFDLADDRIPAQCGRARLRVGTHVVPPMRVGRQIAGTLESGVRAA